MQAKIDLRITSEGLHQSGLRFWGPVVAAIILIAMAASGMIAGGPPGLQLNLATALMGFAVLARATSARSGDARFYAAYLTLMGVSVGLFLARVISAFG